jgi:hypothetical protein
LVVLVREGTIPEIGNHNHIREGMRGKQSQETTGSRRIKAEEDHRPTKL